jgi:HEAT repeat protein
MLKKTASSDLIRDLKSTDADIRRVTAEQIADDNLTEEIVKLLSGMLCDSEKGVRDAVSYLLSYNGNKFIPKYVTPFISSDDITIRNLAGEILLKIGEPAINDILAYIDKGNDDDKKFLIDILGLIGSEKPIEKIIEILNANRNHNVILSCIEAIGNIKYSGALGYLINLYSQDELFKPSVIEAMGKIASPNALEFILEKYKSEDELTRYSIIESLGAMGDESTFFFLLNELKSVNDYLIPSLISSLKNIKEKYNLDLPYEESSKKALLKTLAHYDIGYKKDAAYLLTVFNDPEIIYSFILTYGQDIEIDEIMRPKLMENSRLVFTKVPEILEKNPSNLKHILWLIKDLIEVDGGESLSLLTKLENRYLSDVISNFISDPDEEARRTAIELIFVINQETAFLFLDTMLNDDNFWNRLRLLEILESVFTPAANGAIKKLAEDPEEMIADKANWILAQRGTTQIKY